MSDQANNLVTLPPGVTISPGVESSAIAPNQQNISGMKFTLTLPSGASTNVFVPYTLMKYRDQVEALFANRVNDINGVASIGQ